jgi:hypothetical protein
MSKVPQKKPNAGKNGVPVPSNPAGRPKGSVNKIGKTCKENYEAIFEGIGGVVYAVTFLKSHPRAMEKFLTETYSRCMPLDMKVGGNLGIGFRVIDRVVTHEAAK